MEMEYYCIRCGKEEIYNRQEGTVFWCGSCVASMVGEVKKEKQRRRSGVRRPKEKHTLGSWEKK